MVIVIIILFCLNILWSKIMSKPEIQEIWAMFQETDKKFQKTDKKFQKTDKRLDEKFQATEREIDKLSRSVDKLVQSTRGLTSKWGEFVEELVAPGAIRVFNDRGIKVEELAQRVSAKRSGMEMEIDILLTNDQYTVAIEVKSTLTLEDVKYFLKKLDNFKKVFPRYKVNKVLGGVAGVVIHKGVDRYAYQKGLFVIKPFGDSITIANDDKFRAREW